MKKYRVMLIILSLLSLSFEVFGQWQTETRLTNDPSNSFGGQVKSIAVYGNNIHVVWQDHRDGDAEVYYKRSTNSGASWSSDQRLSPLNYYSGAPTIAINQSTIHVFWTDQRIAALDIYYVRSTDNGTTWQPEIRITTDPMDSQYPAVSVSGNNIYLCWEDNRDNSNREIYFKRSTNSGLNWSIDVRITTDTSASDDVTVSSFGQNVHAAWESGTGNSEIYYKNSTNGGISWSADQRLTNDPAVSFYPEISQSGQNINLFWSDTRDGNSEIYFKRSTDGGIVWTADTRLTNAANNSIVPNAVSFGQLIAVVWSDLRNNFYKIYYKTSTNGGLNWSSDLLISPVSNSGSAVNSSIDVSDSSAHVVWEDSRHGSPEIYYRKNIFSFPVGIITVTNEIPSGYSLSQNYPNPFNPVTNFEFTIADFGLVNLTIYDVLGRAVETLVNNELNPGTYKAELDASKYNSGVYFYRLSSGNYTETKKMILVK